MNDRIGCEAFQNTLDEVRAGTAGPGAWDRLRRHGTWCPDCATLLRHQELLLLPAPEELERAVPTALTDSMWPRVQEGIGRQRARAVQPAARGRGWLIPFLSAAVVVLMLGAGALAIDRGRLRDREAALTRTVAAQEHGLAGLGPTEASTGSSTATRRTVARLERAWGDRTSVTVGELEDRLDRLPHTMTLVNASDADAAIRAVTLWGRSGSWRDVLERIDARDGLQTGELLEAVRGLDLGRDASIPASRIPEIFAAARPVSRS